MNELPTATMRRLTVREVAGVGPRIRRITLAGGAPFGAGLDDFAPLPGQDVVVHLVDEGGAGVRRRYTIRHLDLATSSFDLDVVVHGHGVGSTWGSTARPGDSVEIFGPRGKVVLSDAEWQLFLGDESALAAIAEMVQALPATVAAVALIEVTDASDEQPIGGAGDVDVRWLHRHVAAPGTADALLAALAGVRLENPSRHAYVFGESRVVRRLREELAALGFRPDQISAKGYWNVGRASRD
jgi:NADPH-dependent ferric siderophore reductase